MSSISQEGAFVKKGQLLFEIDLRPFQATLEVAAAALRSKVQAGDTLSSVGHAHPDSKGQVSPAPTCMLLVISDLCRLLALAVKGQGVCTLRGMAHVKEN